MVVSHHTEHAVEHEASVHRTSSTVHSIEKTLGKNHTDHIGTQARSEIYHSLHQLSQHDPNFHKDLTTINAELQHDGYLPGLFIDENKGQKFSADKAIGPNSKDGFHLSKTEYEPAPLAPKGTKPVEAPTHAPNPGPSQGEWHRQNPGNPVGSTGGEGNIGGSTPIAGSGVESNPVGYSGGNLGNLSAINQQWGNDIMQALQMLNAQRKAEGLPPIPMDQQSMQDIETIILHESSGNPNAQNNSDSNAAAGDPSRGLMQTIGTTFSSYHVQGTSSNIFDPVANIAAGINYAVSRYGSLSNVPGIVSLSKGGSYVGY